MASRNARVGALWLAVALGLVVLAASCYGARLAQLRDTIPWSQAVSLPTGARCGDGSTAALVDGSTDGVCGGHDDIASLTFTSVDQPVDIVGLPPDRSSFAADHAGALAVVGVLLLGIGVVGLRVLRRAESDEGRDRAVEAATRGRVAHQNGKAVLLVDRTPDE